MWVSYAFNGIFLVCLVFIIVVFSFLFGVWFLLYYGAEEDKGLRVATFPKMIFILAFTLTLIGVFLMPYSLFSRRLNMSDDWYLVESICYQVYYFFVIAMALFVIPFSICYYEAEDPYVRNSWIKQTICGGVCSGVIVFVFLAIFLSTYFFLGFAEVPYVGYIVDQGNPSANDLGLALQAEATKCPSCTMEDGKYSLMTSFVIYMVALVTLVGYALFIIFGGCGLTALPVKCICGFIRRSKGMDVSTFSALRQQFRLKTERLLDVGEKIDRKIEMGDFSSPANRIIYNDYKNVAHEVMEDWKKVKESYTSGGSSVILSFAKLGVGIIGGLVSLLWVIHILLYVAFQPKFSFGFLNIALSYADYFTSGFPIVGTVLYGILTFHLILSVFSGTEEVFGTIPLIAIHPLSKKDTMMSSLLWNVEIFLLVGISINQFAAYAFADFARDTVLNMIFGRAIQNLKFFWVFYDYIVKYGFLLCTVLGFVYIIIKTIIPKKKSKDEKRLANLQKGVSRSYGGLFRKDTASNLEKKKLLINGD